MTPSELQAIRERNEARKADQAAVVQPEGAIVRMAADIDALLAEVERALSLCPGCMHALERHNGDTECDVRCAECGCWNFQL